VELAQAEVHAAESGSDPKISLYADAGDSGATPWSQGEFTRGFGVELSLPIFDGGLTEAETEAAESRQRQAEIQQQDTLREIEKEVRDAFDLMLSARERLQATREARELARKELLMTEHRFEAGITTNLEVIQAQTSLTLAEATYLNALASYNVALVQVAASAGRPDLLLDIYHKTRASSPAANQPSAAEETSPSAACGHAAELSPQSEDRPDRPGRASEKQ
jgi:outer membrane protein TolC